MNHADPMHRLNTALEGRYRIERELGEGGMATVFLATDVRHDRQVALKVLKPELGAVVGGERFLAEIRTTANLQHPHILPLFDSGEADGLIFYVMPYVEGESLQDRLERERYLPVEDAVRIAVKVLAALEHAHRAGVVHRDVKPANILLSGGEPLVADFGIALAVSQAGDGRITETGLTLGTPHYMSPEQATGDRAVDPRSDLWAVACVLYEMLAGQPPFTGATAQAVLAKLLTEEAPDLREQRSSVPEHVAAAVDTGLERLPADRFQTAREFAEALERPGHGVRPGTRRTAAAAGTPAHPLRRAAGVLGWVVAAALAGVWLLGWGAGEPVAPPDPLRFTLPMEQAAGVDRNSSTALSPAEDLMAFDVRGADRTGIFLHRFATGVTEAIPDTELGRSPFFSPDGRQVGFFTEAAVHAADLATGRVEVLARDPTLGIFDQRGIWLDDGHILVDHSETEDLWMVPPGSSRVVLLAAADADEEVVAFEITSRSAGLPGGHALVTGYIGANEAVPVLVTPATREVRRLSGDGTEGVVLGAWGDTVVVGRSQTRIVAFVEVDPGNARGRVVGERPLNPMFTAFRQKFALGPRLMTGLFSDAGGSQTVDWIDASGNRTPVGLPTADWEYPRVSPIGHRLLVTESSSTGAYEVQVVLDVRTGATTPLPDGGEHTWSHDGRHVYFQGSEDDGGFTIVRHRADGTGRTEVVASGLSQPPWVTSASPDGGSVLFYSESIQEVDPATGEVRVLIDDDGIERNGMFSPDGRFIAYSATGSGREVVYVKPYPELDRRWTISPGEGRLPMWSRDGRTLYYIDGDRVYSVAVETSADGELQPAAPELFFQGDFYLHPSGDQSYDVAPDGSLVMIQGNRQMRVEVTVDWRGYGEVTDPRVGGG